MLKFSRTTATKAAVSAVLLCMCLGSVSCRRHDPEVGSRAGAGAAGGDVIRLALGQKSPMRVMSKAGCQESESMPQLEPVMLENEDVRLLFTPVVSRIDDEVAVKTKGVYLTSENVITLRDRDVAVTAYGMNADSTAAHVPAQAITYKGSWYDEPAGMSNWDFLGGRSYHWPSTSSLTFFAWTPAAVIDTTKSPEAIKEHFILDTESGSVKFDYAMAEPAILQNDFVNQPDVAFADTTMRWTNENGGRVDLAFDHMLSAVSFEIGRTSIVTVKSITLENILSEGSCEYNPKDPVKPVDWTGVKTAKAYTQVYNAEIPQNAYDSSKPEGEGNKTLPIGEKAGEAIFMVIPQKSGDAGSRIKLSVTFVTSEKPEAQTLSAELDADMANWQPGYKYTYILSGLGNTLLIDVKDEMSGNVKSDLVISNTDQSDVKCYIRALIIGNWFENLAQPTDPEAVPGRIVVPWSIADGTFNPALPATAGTSVNNWTLGCDGFYYYKYPVHPGRETGVKADGTGTADKLFTTYTAPGESPIEGTFLRVDIVAQGVRWDEGCASAKAAWEGSDPNVASYLSESDKN